MSLLATPLLRIRGAMPRCCIPSVASACLAQLSLIAAVAHPARAQSPYALIGTDEMVQADFDWGADASLAEKYETIFSRWAEDDGFSGSILVASGGRLVFEGSYGFANREFRVRNDSATRYRAGFLGAFFTATLAGALADEGYFDLDDTLGEHLPSIAPDVGRVTLAQLIANTSGLEQDVFRYVDKGPSDQFAGFGEFIELLDRVERRGEPGSISPTGTAAVSLDYILLGAVIESTVGEPFESVMQARLLDSLRLHDTGFHGDGKLVERLASSYQDIVGTIERVPDPNYSYTRAFGAMFTTPRDFYRLASFVYGPAGTENVRRAYGAAGGGPRRLVLDGDRPALPPPDSPRGQRFRLYADTNGWIQGETSLLGHFVQSGDILIVMSNMHRAAVIYDLRRRWARTVVGMEVGVPAPRVRTDLWRVLREEGSESAAAFYQGAGRDEHAVDLPWPDEFMMYSRSLRTRRRFAEALLITDLYIRIQPEFYLPYREMGEVYRAIGDPQRATQYFEEALSRNPDSPAWIADMEAYIAEHADASRLHRSPNR